MKTMIKSTGLPICVDSHFIDTITNLVRFDMKDRNLYFDDMDPYTKCVWIVSRTLFYLESYNIVEIYDVL